MDAKVFRVINELVDSGVIDTYAIGGAIAAIFYTEPVITYDLDVFIPISVQQSGLVSLGHIYEHLATLGYHPKGEFIEVEGWSVQFLPIPNPLIDEGVQNARSIEVDGGDIVRVLSPEYLVAVALQTGRAKDFARIRTFKDLGVVDMPLLMDLIKRFDLEGQWQKYQMLK